LENFLQRGLLRKMRYEQACGRGDHRKKRRVRNARRDESATALKGEKKKKKMIATSDSNPLKDGRPKEWKSKRRPDDHHKWS